jgi:hypothetical protein
MKVYHGSYKAIETIDFSFCQIKRDFGKGFYVSKFRDQAEVWSIRKGKEHRAEAVVTEFDFSELFFRDNDLKVLRFDDYCDEWLDFVVLNRKNETEQQAHDFDIVEGPVANDKIATEVDRYLEGLISKKQFLDDLTHNPSHQICFCTMQSLHALSQQKGKIEIATYDIGDKVIQSLMVDCDISELEAVDRYYTSKTYSQLAVESTEFYKKPWQEIYELLKQELK